MLKICQYLKNKLLKFSDKSTSNTLDGNFLKNETDVSSGMHL